MSESDQQPPATHLYSTQGIVMGTILGSLVAGIVMIYLNYLALGRENLARTVSTWGAVLFIAIIVSASFVPATAVSALVFMGLQAGIAYFLAEKLQGAAIRYHQERAGQMHSNLRAASVGLLSGMALFFLLMLVSIVWAVAFGVGSP